MISILPHNDIFLVSTSDFLSLKVEAIFNSDCNQLSQCAIRCIKGGVCCDSKQSPDHASTSLRSNGGYWAAWLYTRGEIAYCHATSYTPCPWAAWHHKQTHNDSRGELMPYWLLLCLEFYMGQAQSLSLRWLSCSVQECRNPRQRISCGLSSN